MENQILPLPKLYSSKHWHVFVHPQPAYAFHLLLVPRSAYASITDMETLAGEVMADLLLGVEHLVNQHQLEKQGYRLITNGGVYQEVKMPPFHLVSGGEKTQPIPGE